MAVQTITYDDKQYLNQNSDIADINKVKDTDMNMIKSVVNNNASETNNNQSIIYNYFDLNTTEIVTSGTITGGGTLSGINITIEKNQDGSLAKINGQMDVATGGHAGNVTFNTSLRPTTQLSITGMVYRSISNGGTVRNNSIVNLTIGTDGKITVPYVYSVNTSDSCRLSIINGLVFIKNIGD